MVKRKEYFAGRSVKEISSMSMEEFNSLDRAQLSNAVTRLSSAANKRVRSMQKEGLESPAMIGYEKQGSRKFSARGKDINELRAEFIRVRNFLGRKTSTKSGYKKFKKEFYDRVKTRTGKDVELTEEQLRNFWDVINKSENLDSFVGGSTELQKYVYSVYVEDTALDSDDLFKIVQNKFEGMYHTTQDIMNNEFDTSSQFKFRGTL